MNKTTLRAMSMSLAAALALPAMPLTTFAADTGSITVKAAADQSLAGKTFTAFELFSLTYLNTGADDTNKDDDYAYDLLPEYESFFLDNLGLTVSHGETVDSAAYNYISGCSRSELNSFTKAVYDYVSAKGLSGKTGTASDDKTYRIDGLEDGYYLVFETVTEEGGTLSKGILSSIVAEVDSEGNTGVKNVVVTQKADIPSLDKQIYHNELGTWGEVGDNQIGDVVDYRIITSIPDTFGYSDYTYVIHDYMEDGLTFSKDSLKVYTDEAKTEEVATGWQLSVDKADGCDFEVAVDRATLDTLYAAGKTELYIYFDCILNVNAEIANEHNDNTAYLEYSNNPYINTTSKGREDTVYDYTFVLDATKINAAGNTLKNAEFQIIRDGKALELLKDNSNAYYVKGNNAQNEMTETDTIVTAADGKVVIKGLDDAVRYTLRETKAPAGYVKAADIDFTIKADYDDATNLLSKLSEDSKALKVSSYRIEGDIIDDAQPDLPITGGPGTIAIYTVSALSGLAALMCFILGRAKKKEN